MVCFVADAEGVPHIALGMVKPITVIESDAPLAAEPVPDVSIDMDDFEFGFWEPSPRGHRIFELPTRGNRTTKHSWWGWRPEPLSMTL